VTQKKFFYHFLYIIEINFFLKIQVEFLKMSESIKSDENDNVEVVIEKIENLSLSNAHEDENNSNSEETSSDVEVKKSTNDNETPIKPKKFNNVIELRKEMARLGLNLKGNKDELKKRYKKYIKKQEEIQKNR